MNSIDFNGSVLLISARSPFARRVRLAFDEHGINYDEKTLNVFEPNPELTKLNPLSRVPTLILRNGAVLIESQIILQAFYENVKSPLHPADLEQRLAMYKWSGIALGLCEKLVEYYLEKLKPKEMHDQVVFKEFDSAYTGVLSQFEEFIGDRHFIVEGQMTQADLDMGAALTYLNLRYSTEWAGKYAKTSSFLKRLQTRPSFERTNPPA